MDTFQRLHSASKANTGPLVIKRPALVTLCLTFQPVCHRPDSCFSSERGFLLCRQWNITKVQSFCLWLIAQEWMQHLSRWAFCFRENTAVYFFIAVSITQIRMHLLFKGDWIYMLRYNCRQDIVVWNETALKVFFTLWPTLYLSPLPPHLR